MNKVKITADISMASDEAMELIKDRTGITKSKIIAYALDEYLLDNASDDPIINKENFRQILLNHGA